MKHFVLLLPACLALTACVESNTHHHHHGPADNAQMHNHTMGSVTPNSQHMMGQNGRFSCQNGLAVNIRHLGNDRIELQLDDNRAILNSAVSGSGEFYSSDQGLFGSGAQWHQKANEAIFSFADPYGNHVETICRGN